MAYDDSAFRRRDTGVREDAEFRTPTYQVSEFREADTTDSTLTMSSGSRGSSTSLNDVFDDPEHGDPGRDRLAVHIVWELVLLLAAAAAAYLLLRESSDALRGGEFKALMVFAAAVGLLALGAGLSLRAGAVNLAIGPVAMAASLHYAEQGDRGLLTGAGMAVAVAAAAGLVLGVVVVGLHVPGWAASLAGGLGVIVFIQQRGGPVAVQGDYDPKDHALYLFGGMILLAVLGGLIGTIKPVRRAVGRFRPVGDPAWRRGGLAGLLTTGAIMLSTAFAAGAGVLLSAGRVDPVVPTTGLELTGLGVGAALLAGTSAFGRRGGVFGTALAVVLIALAIRFFEVRELDVSTFGVAAVALGVGLAVTRLVESFGRPRLPADEQEAEWAGSPDGDATTPSWSQRQESWSAALPAQPTAGRSDPWESDRWSSSR